MEKKELRKKIEELDVKRKVREMRGDTPDYDTNNRYHYVSEEDILELLDKAREEGKREQAELDRVLYSVSFEHIKNADFEKILLESVDKAKENIIKDLIKKIEEAHCDSISLELLKEIDLSKLK